jgi:hypothetical protein
MHGPLRKEGVSTLWESPSKGSALLLQGVLFSLLHTVAPPIARAPSLERLAAKRLGPRGGALSWPRVEFSLFCKSVSFADGCEGHWAPNLPAMGQTKQAQQRTFLRMGPVRPIASVPPDLIKEVRSIFALVSQERSDLHLTVPIWPTRHYLRRLPVGESHSFEETGMYASCCESPMHVSSGSDLETC